MSSLLLDLLYPPHCLFCGRIMADRGISVCPECTKNLPFAEDGKILRKIGKHTCAVTFYYDGPARLAIRSFKFHGKSQRARGLARYLVQTAAEHLSGEFDLVTYVPIHFLRRMARGYDQTALLAREAAKLWAVKTVKTLVKKRNNRPQSTVKGVEKRRANVRDVYRAVHPERFAGRRVLLIDDVVTTGSTLSVCADLLLAAGAESVVCVAFAGGHRGKAGEKAEKTS